MKIKHILKITGLISAFSFASILFISCDGDKSSASVPSIDRDITGLTPTEEKVFYLSSQISVVAEGTVTSLSEEGGTFNTDGNAFHEFTVNLNGGEGEIIFTDPEFSEGNIDANGNFSYKIDRSRIRSGQNDFVTEDIATVTGRFGYRESDNTVIGVATENRIQRIMDNGSVVAKYTIQAEHILEVESGVSLVKPLSLVDQIIYSIS